MKERICCFTGHRDINEKELANIKSKTERQIIGLIEKGVINFVTGGARGFDTLAAEMILKLKKTFPNIKLILVLPCVNQTKGWNKSDADRYDYIKSKADKVKILSKNYYSGCMHFRNQYMVENSAYCIFYCRKKVGGTFYTANYAVRKGLSVIFI